MGTVTLLLVSDSSHYFFCEKDHEFIKTTGCIRVPHTLFAGIEKAVSPRGTKVFPRREMHSGSNDIPNSFVGLDDFPRKGSCHHP